MNLFLPFFLIIRRKRSGCLNGSLSGGLARLLPPAVMVLAVLLFLPSVPALAQNGFNGNNDDVTATISVSASVTATTDMEVAMITLRDIVLDRQVTREEEIVVDPMTSINAGQMRAEGEPNAEVRISFLQERELTRIGGGETLTFFYEVAGNDIDDQPSSELLELENRDFQLNEDGEYYFWIGGRVDIRGATQGAYDGEFTVEIEYL
ncbi:hypothetical protein QA596_01025 [Balneolales bacterium ANBcel1]|nr:hypothetical protein [Balneolales bacterium ANBcel1]